MKDIINFDTSKFPVLSKKKSLELCVYDKVNNPEVLITDFNNENKNLLRCFYLNRTSKETIIDFEHYDDLPFNSLEMVWLETK